MASRTNSCYKYSVKDIPLKGTHESLMTASKSLKLSKVGLFTRNRGGKNQISSNGLIEFEIAYTSGSIIKMPNSSKNK